MWRREIHSFLELLRHRLPGSVDHMLVSVYLAYSMMAFLMESIPSFLETWIKCLGDLADTRWPLKKPTIEIEKYGQVWPECGIAKLDRNN
jgi:hypothetical protein